MSRQGIVWAVLVVLPLTVPSIARAQGVPANIDSLIAAADSLRPSLTFDPKYQNTIAGNVTSVQMINGFNAISQTKFGVTFSLNASLDRTGFRLQDRSEDNRKLGMALTHRVRPDWTWSATANDSRRNSRVVSLGGGFQDFVLNDRGVNARTSFVPLLEGPVRWDANASASAVSGERIFKSDNTQWAAIGGGVGFVLTPDMMPGFLAGAFPDKVALRVRGATKGTKESSRSGNEILSGLGGAEDSLSAAVSVRMNDSLSVTFDYMDYNAERRYTDQARGSLGDQQTAANLFEEKEIRENRSFNFAIDARPLRGFSVIMKASRDEQLNDYVVTKTRFSRATTDALNADMTYATRWGSQLRMGLSTEDALRDLGPQSVSSYSEGRDKFNVGMAHKFSETLSFDASYSTSLVQTFYLDYANNPRDRDQLDNTVSLTISSSPFPKVSVGVAMSFTSSDFISIDASQSDDNRARTLYDFAPTLTFQINERIVLNQSYGLSIEFTDFTFREEDNVLDRNVRFTNQLRAQLFPNVATRFLYSLQLHDRGSYLPDEPGGPRFLTPDRNDRRDRIELGARYKITPRLSLLADYDFSRRRDETAGSSNVRISEDSGIQVGPEGNYTWGNGRTLKFRLLKANRFGPFATAKQKDFWIMNSELNFAF